MALFKCKECGNMISDKASACPHCGCPVSVEQNIPKTENEEEKQNLNDEESSKSNKNLWLYLIIASLVIIGLFFWGFHMKSDEKNLKAPEVSQNVEDGEKSITEGKYYAIIYKDNTGSFYAPNGGRICGLKLREGRKEPLSLDLNSTFMIMGNNSDNLYVTMERAFSDYSDYLSYYSEYDPDKSLGVDVTRMEKDGIITIAFDFYDGQIDKFDKPAIKIEANDNNEYTAIYYDDETGDLFDDDGSHICGFKKGFAGGCDFSFNLSKTVNIYDVNTDEIDIGKDKIYIKYRDFLDDYMPNNQKESKAKAKVQKEEVGNATIFHFSKNASSQGMVGEKTSSTSETSSSTNSYTSSSKWKGLSQDQLLAKLEGTVWTCRPIGKTWYRLSFRNGKMYLKYATPSMGHWLEEKEWRYEYFSGYTNDTGEKFVSVQFKKEDNDLSYGGLMFFDNGDIEFSWLRGREGGKAECRDFNWD